MAESGRSGSAEYLGEITNELADGRSAEGRGVFFAASVSDTLPTVEGLAERWGKSVFR